jgi:hypothetical protein
MPVGHQIWVPGESLWQRDSWVLEDSGGAREKRMWEEGVVFSCLGRW